MIDLDALWLVLDQPTAEVGLVIDLDALSLVLDQLEAESGEQR